MIKRVICTLITFTMSGAMLAMEQKGESNPPPKTAAIIEARRQNPPPPAICLYARRKQKNSAAVTTVAHSSELNQHNPLPAATMPPKALPNIRPTNIQGCVINIQDCVIS